MAAKNGQTVVVGGGPIGLACAWRLAQRGRSVTVVDRDPGGGASFAAAGMLAPVTEAHYGEEDLLSINLTSAELYPSFVAELESASEISCNYRRTGTLTVAADASDRSQLADLVDYHRRLGLDAELLTGRQARELEPLLAPGTAAASLVPGDHQVDPRRLVSCLIRSCEREGVAMVEALASRVTLERGRVSGVAVAGSLERTFPAAEVVVAAGCHSPSLLKGMVDLPVRPVKGQVLILRPLPGRGLGGEVLSRNLRAVVEGRSIYLVPRVDGRLVLGATVEERGFETAVTVEAVSDLLRLARIVFPAVAEMEIVEILARLRPGSPHNRPFIGACGPEGLFVASGHFRNGILLTPITAWGIAEAVVSGSLPEQLSACDAARLESKLT